MFIKIYLTVAKVLHCYKKCSDFLQYFDGNSPVIIHSQFIFKTKTMFMCMLVKIANWFLLKCVV